MSATIFIRSYALDYPWLSYCLRSLQKFARGFDEIVIAVPEGQEGPLKSLTAERVITVHDARPGYLAQQLSKLTADIHTESDFILHLDSDSVLTREVTPADFMKDGKPVWLMTPFRDVDNDCRRAWLHVMTKCVQRFPEFEFMRRNSIFVPRWAYGEFRAFVKATHGVEVDAYVMGQPGREFSEYNCLGHYLHEFHRERIHWHNTATDGVPVAPEKQGWSWGGLTKEIQAEIEEILK